jgi:hypothetical protein
LSQDPPPDLAIEIDITSSSINRLKLYAALGVPEVWRYDGQTLLMYRLENKDYLVCDRSLAFFLLTPADLERFLDLKKTTKENALVQRFREWVRERLAVEEYLSSNKTAIAINHDRSPLNP